MSCKVNYAKAYPFDIPEASFILDKDGWRPLPAEKHATKNRHAVIASGSNAAPDRLQTKFAGHGHLLDEPVYASRATLHDFDAVYSAHIASYGSVPATLAHAPGAEAEVFVTWLTDEQLERMHETEAVGTNYDYVRFDGIGLVLEHGSGYTYAHAYMSKRGCLNHDGEPVSLAATKTDGRMWKAMTQSEVLDYVRTLTSPHDHTDDFIKAQIDCPDTRADRTAKLAARALDHGWLGSLKVLK